MQTVRVWDNPVTMLESLLTTHIPKTDLGGTHRTRAPEETLAWLKPKWQEMGITRLADITGLDRIGLPVYMSVRPNAKTLSVSQGKGITHSLAKASALMEAIELYHAENIDLPTITASYVEMKAREPHVCAPSTLNLHSQSIYHLHYTLRWIQSYDLIQEQVTWLPLDLIDFSHSANQPILPHLFDVTSNGLASGNHKIEAISHAICEVVERDAFRMWQIYNLYETATQCLDLSTIQHTACHQLLRQLEAAHIDVYVWDITSDVGIPAFAATILEQETHYHLMPIGIFQGMGCHLSKEVALMRAITEAIQSRLTYIAGSRDDIYRDSYDLVTSPFYLRRRRQNFEGVDTSKDFAAIPSLATNDITADVQIQLAKIQQIGLNQVLVVDLSQPEIDVPVVFVVIPHLENKAQDPTMKRGKRARQAHLVRQLMKGWL